MTDMTDAESNDEDVAREGRGRSLEDDILHIQVKEKVLTPTFALLCVAVLMSSLGALGIYIDNRDDRQIIQQTAQTAENTNRVVKDIERRQSPEALEEQAAQIDAVILRVACNDRIVLDDFADTLLDTLTAQGVLPEGTEVTVEIPPECQEVLPGG